MVVRKICSKITQNMCEGKVFVLKSVAFRPKIANFVPMKRTFSMLCLCTLLVVVTMGHAVPLTGPGRLDSLFVGAPPTVLPLLTRNMRLDLLDYQAYGQPAVVTNRFEGRSEMTVHSDTLIALRLTPVSTWRLRMLLPVSAAQCDTLLEVTHTVCRPDTESVKRLYNLQWQPL